ncbi:MAG: nucleoside recognition protein [Gammaproteobacteria bacterium]|nr:nucleoside recognition protein [Gammaproteobacteria bacterium]
MLNIIWLLLICTSVVFGAINHQLAAVVAAVTDSAKVAFELVLGLTGIMVFWLGLMRIAEACGLVQLIARILRPVLRRLFPEVPPEHPAMGEMVMNMSANMLGLLNAATPLGLKAMQSLETLNPYPGVATNPMCMFLAINTSSIQLIPVSAMAYLAAGGAINPADIIGSGLLASICSTIAAIVAVKILVRLPCFNKKVYN